jgi:hypothetical protein
MSKAMTWRCLAGGVALACAGVLGACGGDDNNSPQGIYQGSFGASFMEALIVDNGDYVFLYGTSGGTLFGAVQGTSSHTNSGFSSSNAVNFSFAPGLARTTGSITGTYAQKSNMSGTLTDNLSQQTAFSGNYDAGYDTAASLGAVAGSYTGSAATTTLSGDFTMTISGSGAISGTTPTLSVSPCTFTGTATPHPGGKNVFDFSISFTSTTCQFGQVTLTGYAFPTTAGNQVTLYASAVLPDRSNGFFAVANRQ